MFRYYELCTDLTMTEIGHLRRDVTAGRQHPRTVKAELAKLIIRDFHSLQAAREAEEEFNRVFQKGLAPVELEERSLPVTSERVRLTKLIAQLGLASSVAEASRLIEQEAVSLNNYRITNVKAEVDLSRPASHVLKVGKRRFLKVTIG
jgi:tyrosyl-tRNA synthetase